MIRKQEDINVSNKSKFIKKLLSFMIVIGVFGAGTVNIYASTDDGNHENSYYDTWKCFHRLRNTALLRTVLMRTE